MSSEAGIGSAGKARGARGGREEKMGVTCKLRCWRCYLWGKGRRWEGSSKRELLELKISELINTFASRRPRSQDLLSAPKPARPGTLGGLSRR